MEDIVFETVSEYLGTQEPVGTMKINKEWLKDAVLKQNAMTPIPTDKDYLVACHHCLKTLTKLTRDQYCRWCGQKLDWEEEK